MWTVKVLQFFSSTNFHNKGKFCISMRKSIIYENILLGSKRHCSIFLKFCSIVKHTEFILVQMKKLKKYVLLFVLFFPSFIFKFFLTPIWKKEGWVRNVENKGKLKTEKELFLCAHLKWNNKSKSKQKGQAEATLITLITELWITWHYDYFSHGSTSANYFETIS